LIGAPTPPDRSRKECLPPEASSSPESRLFDGIGDIERRSSTVWVLTELLGLQHNYFHKICRNLWIFEFDSNISFELQKKEFRWIISNSLYTPTFWMQKISFFKDSVVKKLVVNLYTLCITMHNTHDFLKAFLRFTM
jgi:hypothetical protein